MTKPPFSENDYDNNVFKGMQCHQQQWAGVTFSDCVFEHCSFEESVIKGCKFKGCVFSHCNLNLAQVEGSSFSNTLFEQCTVIGVNWARAAWGKGKPSTKFRAIDFVGCVLNYSSFATLNLPRLLMQKCVCREVDFSEANLSKANFTFTDLVNSTFRHIDLSEADLTGTTDYVIQPQNNTLRKTRFSLPEAMSLLYNLDIEIVEAVEG